MPEVSRVKCENAPRRLPLLSALIEIPISDDQPRELDEEGEKHIK